MKEIRPGQDIHSDIRIPGSKSISHRALIAASLAEGESVLKDFLASEDTLYTANALRTLGVSITFKDGNATVLGTGGRFPPSSNKKEIFFGNSGTSYRFLLSTVALAHGEYTLTGTPRMHERPVGDMVRALNKLGVDAACIEKKDFPPVHVKAGGIHGGKVDVAGGKSSQFVSSLLLCGPCAKTEVEIEVKGELVSSPYVRLTLDIMGQFGVSVVHEGYRLFKIPAGQRYASRNFRIEGDVSSASYFWAAAAVTGKTVMTKNIYPHTTNQGDIGFLKVLEGMGCTVERGTDYVVVCGGSLTGIDVDMSTMPDMVPTLAAVAPFARGETVIRNVPHLRHKESDRLRAIAQEWRRLGAKVRELPDGLIICGNQLLSGAVVDPHDDHRLAMALAVVGLNVPGIKVRNEGCVNKSFPQFWELFGNGVG